MYMMIYQMIKKRKGKDVILDGLDSIVSNIYIKKYIIASSTYYVIIGKSLSN